ncbi:MAG TPA: DUF935 family protein [Kofleriaceae bacterium]|nr:DUF935 family protein [Kofleriaceae bacterium]
MPGLDDPAVERTRASFGGQIARFPTTRTRLYLEDLEAAEYAADAGEIALAAQIMNAAGRDGVHKGVMGTRTSGLVQLPRRFKGRSDMVDALQSGGTVARSVFDEMFPPAELAKLAADGIRLGVGVAELVPVEGRSFPVMVTLNPEFLIYLWAENRWYYWSIAGLIPITPGDGRWILHVPGARMSPWREGLWRALGRAYIRKEHASLYKDNWESKLAHPARVAVAPNAATEEQRQSWFRKVMAWGLNTVFGLPAGYDVKLLESNGRGYESFNLTIADQDKEMIIAIAGQTVTTDGGTGFANADIHKTIRADLIKADGAALAYTLNTQGLPVWTLTHYGEDALAESPIVEWDTDPPKDKAQEANALTGAANAIKSLTEAIAQANLPEGVARPFLDIAALLTRFGAPTRALPAPDAANDSKPSNVVSITREAA